MVSSIFSTRSVLDNISICCSSVHILNYMYKLLSHVLQYVLIYVHNVHITKFPRRVCINDAHFLNYYYYYKNYCLKSWKIGNCSFIYFNYYHISMYFKKEYFPVNFSQRKSVAKSVHLTGDSAFLPICWWRRPNAGLWKSIKHTLLIPYVVSSDYIL